MSYRDYCGLCGESYDDENLETCGKCYRSFCYHCGSFGEKLCRRCGEADQAATEPSATEPSAPSQEDAGQTSRRTE